MSIQVEVQHSKDFVTQGTSNDHVSSTKSDITEQTNHIVTSKMTKPLTSTLSRFGRYQRDAGLTVAIVVGLLNLFTFVPVLISIITRLSPNAGNLEDYRSIIMCLTVNSLINPCVYVFRMKSLKLRVMKYARSFCVTCRCHNR